MNKIIWLIMVGSCFVVFVCPAWSFNGCRVLDYAEIKDMSDAELVAEIDYMNKESLEQLTYGNKMTELGAHKQGDNAYEASRVCEDQLKRFWSVRQKRPSIAVKPPTYDECLDKLKKFNLEREHPDMCDK